MTSIDIISLDDVRRKHSGHFFDSGTTRFFRSRYPQTAYRGPGGVFFVTSEQFVPSSGQAWDRQYTVRRQSETGDISTVGEFNKLSKSSANRIARQLAEGVEVQA